MNQNQNKKIYIISLGCSKNQVDSEFLLGSLVRRGYEVTQESLEAGVILVNTCAFIQPAVEESIEIILEMADVKKSGQAWALVVAGCLPQRFQHDLALSLPEVDLFCGTGEINLLPGLLDALARGRKMRSWPLSPPGFIPPGSGPRLQAAPFFRAYLKIADGCSNACSYCLLPRLRGPFKSRPLEDLVDEAESLVENGVQELILVAQDTTAYGRDLSPATNLAALLERLVRVQGFEWLRVMYAYPSGVSDELIEVMGREPKICHYLDLPLQHASPGILERMGRGGEGSLPDLLARLRRGLPGLSLRTTLMVGFPGETDADFEQLLEFVKQSRFNHLGVFKFFPEEGTAAARFPNQVPQRIKENRRRKLMALQRRISRKLNQARTGQILPVLIESRSDETGLFLVSRTQGQAPEVDGQVLITRGEVHAGKIVPVKITHALDYDLIGEVVEGSGSGRVLQLALP